MSWEGEAAEAAWQMIGHGRSHPEGERRAGFNTGARWQRDQLRTDEAVERLALHLIKDEGIDVSNGWPTNEYFGGGPAGDRDVEFKRAWMKSTRAAITALLGEES